jgi:dihydroneopterin aldolase / 2-amino-4-hydroxy-6-hydroxymethyldihydropteridine diphosphokinase / dihydropteroate synthase
MIHQIETDLEPLNLLALLKTIEDRVGRVPSQHFGPRAVDLDIVFYDDKVIDTRPLQERNRLDNLTGQLVVPHPRLSERDFVLRPLNE